MFAKCSYRLSGRAGPATVFPGASRGLGRRCSDDGQFVGGFHASERRGQSRSTGCGGDRGHGRISATPGGSGFWRADRDHASLAWPAWVCRRIVGGNTRSANECRTGPCLNVFQFSERSARRIFGDSETRRRAQSVQQHDPTDQRGPSRQRHNVDQLATAPRPVSAVPCKVMHRIGFIRISLDCRHGCTPKVPPRRHVKCG
jgi:hypothetical protein